jgi:hypothetical protein
MNRETRQQILNEAIRIGDELLSLAEYDENSISWKSMSMDNEQNIVWHKSESIYGGVSGIVLFLLELYRQTKNEKYLNSAIEGIRWVENYCKDNYSDYYAFFTGRMGVSYTFIKMFEVTGDSNYLEKALNIAKQCSNFLNSSYTVDDLINGTSGILLGLLHLHSATGEKWILETIELFIKHLIGKAHHGPKGLYWDRSDKQIKGLCGFSHGAGGIGFVFLELGHYFQNEAFYWIAEQAFLYESNFYDESKKNWQDLRKGIYTEKDYEEHKKAYLENNLDFFTKGGDMNAWCHGSAGIGLSRLRAFELLKKSLYENEISLAINKTKTTDIELENSRQTFTLCHGSGGNSELFLEAYRMFKDENYLSLAEKVATRALKLKKDKNIYLSGYAYSKTLEDTSLFMGNAGIGYFYLKLLEPLKVPSILAPKISRTGLLFVRDSATILNGAEQSSSNVKETISEYSEIIIPLANIKRKIIEIIFKRTLFITEKLIPDEIKKYFERETESRENEKEKFINFMKNIIAILPEKEQKCVYDIFSLELEKVKMDEEIKSYALLNIKELVNADYGKKLIEMGSDSFLNLELILDSDVKIILTSWNWNLVSQDNWINNLNLEPEMYPVLLRASAKEIVERGLSLFSYSILSSFQNGNTVRNVIDEIVNEFEVDSAKQKDVIKDKIVKQIKELIIAGILVEKN